MGKVRKNRKTVVKTWINVIGEKYFVPRGRNVLCQACNLEIFCTRKSQLTQHKKTQAHTSNVALREEELNAVNENDSSSHANEFYSDLCEAMVATNISWRSLDNSTFRDFLQKYMHRNIPDESTLRKNYLPICYDRKMEEIRKYIGDSYLWISVDGTTDRSGRYIANLIIGKMCEEEPSDFVLLACRELEQTNSSNVARFVNCALQELKKTPGPCGKRVAAKVEAVMQRNPSFGVLSKLHDVLNGSRTSGPHEIDSNVWSKFKYSPITSCDVERSFSAYKLIYSEKRQNLTVDNLEKIMVIYCNKNYTI